MTISALPEISDAAVHFIRSAYGVLLLMTLVGLLPEARRFLLSERWGGYAQSSKAVDMVQNPRVLPAIIAVWFASSLLLITGTWAVVGALVNLALCRYFFIWMRWRGVLRGMGAPGFMTYWLGLAVCLLELATQFAGSLRPLVLLGLQVDLALILLAAAISKMRSGYLQNHGIERGLANPQWGYWWRWYRRLPPQHPLFWVLNYLAWSLELGAALAMLLPPTRFAGGLLLIATFVFISTQIRLGLLPPMLMLCGALFFAPDTLGGRALAELGGASVTAASGLELPALITGAAAGLIVTYIGLLPFAYGGLALNFYRRRRLPEILQKALERYTNLFGIILWRVFSEDIIGFFVEIHTQRSDGSGRAPVSDYRNRLFHRFAHVGEMITIASVFTTLKYFPSRPELFRERLRRYVRTLPCPPGAQIALVYVSVRRLARSFGFVPVLEFVVDRERAVVSERVLEPDEASHLLPAGSPVHEAARPGTYAPGV